MEACRDIDLVQLLYYAGFAVLGWWLRHQGLLRTPNSTPTPALPAASNDRQALLELLKSLLDRWHRPRRRVPRTGSERLPHSDRSRRQPEAAGSEMTKQRRAGSVSDRSQ